MSETNIIHPEELEFHVQSLKSFQVIDIGSTQWIELHEIILKLNQQAILEAMSYQEEAVKDLLVLNNKLPVLIHEAYCVLVWRTKILPKLLKIDVNPKASFMIYAVLFHEAAAISLLETVLYHESGCESMGDSALDTIDYCVQAITQLIGLTNLQKQNDFDLMENIDETGEQELERQKRDLQYKIGMQCLVILSYFADKIGSLPLNALRRLVKTHDTPYLLSEILHCKPWIRQSKKGVEKYIDNNWKPVRGADVVKVTKVEAQSWFCLRQLLLNGKTFSFYEINDFRQRELGRCQALLNDALLDQIPPLNDLKYFLCSLTVSGNQAKNSIFLEEVPQIRENLLANAKHIGISEIVKKHSKIFIELNQDEVFNAAKRLQEVYNIDNLTAYEEHAKKKCGTCGKQAEKKCSKCERIYYCCRECQVKDWPEHKNECEQFKFE